MLFLGVFRDVHAPHAVAADSRIASSLPRIPALQSHDSKVSNIPLQSFLQSLRTVLINFWYNPITERAYHTLFNETLSYFTTLS